MISCTIAGLSIIGGVIYFSASCSSYMPIDESLKDSFVPWYNSLTNSSWNKNGNQWINYFCNSEQQAIVLYSWKSGTFWNYPLHLNEIPQNMKLKLQGLSNQPLEIRDSDYQYMDSGLAKAIYLRDDVLWHGVEYIELEYWKQLEPFIKKVNVNDYDYSGCVGKTIESYGFISTRLDKNYALSFGDWRPPYNWPNIAESNPLKEKVAFKINIKKGYKGAICCSFLKWSKLISTPYIWSWFTLKINNLNIYLLINFI